MALLSEEGEHPKHPFGVNNLEHDPPGPAVKSRTHRLRLYLIQSSFPSRLTCGVVRLRDTLLSEEGDIPKHPVGVNNLEHDPPDLAVKSRGPLAQIGSGTGKFSGDSENARSGRDLDQDGVDPRDLSQESDVSGSYQSGESDCDDYPGESARPVQNRRKTKH